MGPVPLSWTCCPSVPCGWGSGWGLLSTPGAGTPQDALSAWAMRPGNPPPPLLYSPALLQWGGGTVTWGKRQRKYWAPEKRFSSGLTGTAAVLVPPLCGAMPPPPPPGCIGREGTSEAAPEAVRLAVGGGCQSGGGRLLSVANAVEAGTWRQGASGRAWAGRPGGGGYLPRLGKRQRKYWAPEKRFSSGLTGTAAVLGLRYSTLCLCGQAHSTPSTPAPTQSPPKVLGTTLGLRCGVALGVYTGAVGHGPWPTLGECVPGARPAHAWRATFVLSILWVSCRTVHALCTHSSLFLEYSPSFYPVEQLPHNHTRGPNFCTLQPLLAYQEFLFFLWCLSQVPGS